ncbi:tetratricopeptide (TPR) repeat protein [Haloferula luteola]|uniref:Tetratricopeptide (TPR) repeat protein n=1 Tax=Haloferula luteola TaxID=595692 RepID=A0A840VLQ2_9BACT|nr:hypothetical protein [Haloferula luteola]MBB5353551.1 tetratricopeptide (TPR) repeat protein [Haloferula luteola]
MKALFPVSLAALVLASPVARAQRFQQEAIVVYHEDKFERVWIADASKTQYLYYETEAGVDSKRQGISKPQAIWLMEPAAYTAAMEQFQGRHYEEALKGFQVVREEYQALIELPDNHSSLAAFYSMECLRKLGRYDELEKALADFQPDDRNSLTREFQQKQIELYAMWGAVQAKSWERVESLAKGHLENNKLPGYQRAQAGYCLGLALEALNRPLEALDGYNIAFTADAGASEVVAALAAENSMKLYLQDPEVIRAKKVFGTSDENPNSVGNARLREAAAVAKLYEAALGNGAKLSGELAELPKFAKE